MLDVVRGPNRAPAILTRERTVQEYRAEKVLQFLVYGELYDLIPKLRNRQLSAFRLGYDGLVIRARNVPPGA